MIELIICSAVLSVVRVCVTVAVPSDVLSIEAATSRILSCPLGRWRRAGIRFGTSFSDVPVRPILLCVTNLLCFQSKRAVFAGNFLFLPYKGFQF